MDAVQMQQVLQQLKAMADLVYVKEPYWRVDKMVLMPPAEDHEIAALAAECPFPLPPSYVQFLRLHDGCLNLWPRFALLATKAEPRDIVRTMIEDARVHQSQFTSDEQGQVTQEKIARYEAPDENGKQKFFLANHLVFGTNCAGEFLLFNENRVNAEGEYEVIHHTYSGGAYYRYPDFASYLNFKVEELEKRIKTKGYPRVT